MTDHIIKAAQWKQIPSYPNYEVSDIGDVRRSGKVLSQSLNVNGYPRVTMTVNRKSITRTVHILVAEAFIGPRPKGLHVCHSDGDKTNNKLSNLRYATAKENAADKLLHGTVAVGEKNGMNRHPHKRPIGSKNGFSILNEQAVKEIKEKLKTMKPWGACVKLSKEYGVTTATISLINKGKSWRHV